MSEQGTSTVKRRHSRWAMVALLFFACAILTPIVYQTFVRSQVSGLFIGISDSASDLLGAIFWVIGVLLTLIALIRSLLRKSSWHIPTTAAVMAISVGSAGFVWWNRPSTSELVGACDTGDITEVRRQLFWGADPNAICMVRLGFNPPTAPPIPDCTPLTAAARYRGGIPIIRLLVAHGADINKPDGFGATPLEAAILSKDAERVRVVLELGAKYDAERIARGLKTATYYTNAGTDAERYESLNALNEIRKIFASTVPGLERIVPSPATRETRTETQTTPESAPSSRVPN